LARSHSSKRQSCIQEFRFSASFRRRQGHQCRIQPSTATWSQQQYFSFGICLPEHRVQTCSRIRGIEACAPDGVPLAWAKSNRALIRHIRRCFRQFSRAMVVAKPERHLSDRWCVRRKRPPGQSCMQNASVATTVTDKIQCFGSFDGTSCPKTWT
jgi:hypothetical protein